MPAAEIVKSHYDGVTWASSCPKSMAHQPFVKQLIQISNKENIKAHIMLTGGFPPKWASYAEIGFVS